MQATVGLYNSEVPQEIEQTSGSSITEKIESCPVVSGHILSHSGQGKNCRRMHGIGALHNGFVDPVIGATLVEPCLVQAFSHITKIFVFGYGFPKFTLDVVDNRRTYKALPFTGAPYYRNGLSVLEDGNETLLVLHREVVDVSINGGDKHYGRILLLTELTEFFQAFGVGTVLFV